MRFALGKHETFSKQWSLYSHAQCWLNQQVKFVVARFSCLHANETCIVTMVYAIMIAIVTHTTTATASLTAMATLTASAPATASIATTSMTDWAGAIAITRTITLFHNA